MSNNNTNKLAVLIVLLSIMSLSAAPSPDVAPPTSAGDYLYRATFVRAAPGKLLDLIDLYKKWLPVHSSLADGQPFWWRHTQGDQWDLMLLFPMGSYSEFYSIKRVESRNRADIPLTKKMFLKKFREFSAWHEDIFVLGPDLKHVTKSFLNMTYYHIEMFISLPGKHEELFKERVLENVYQVGVGRPENLIFVRDRGASWDLFTLGCYRDLGHWASSENIPKEIRLAAARKAGFENADQIGPYMRTLIAMHRDTMGAAIK